MHPDKPFHILWHSNSPHAPTGYGNQTGMFTGKIHALENYHVTISAYYGMEGKPAKNDDGIVELPRYIQLYGNDIIESHLNAYKCDMVVSLIDPFVLDPQVWNKFPWCAWVPVDCAPLSVENDYALKAAKWTWSMSKFGHKQLQKAGYFPFYVPHGINTQTFQPVDRVEARKRLMQTFGGKLTEKTFLVTSVAANKGLPSRKNFPLMLRAFAHFAQSHPDALLYLHTESTGGFGGDNIPALAESLGILDKILFPSQYHYIQGLYGDNYLNDIYNASDIFMLLSYGEGFGLPIVEAQAAGCPVVVTDGTAMQELCFSGQKVPAIPIQVFRGAVGSEWMQASLPHAVQALEWAYENRDNTDLRTAARTGAMAYDHNVVFEMHMKPALNAMREQLEEERKPKSDSRARRKAKSRAQTIAKTQVQEVA